MYQRLINLPKSHSFFLFGARGTGKSELLKKFFSKEESLFIDLLDPELSNRLSAYPNTLNEIILPELNKKNWIVIDEVQKVPALLEIVHKQISQKNFHFALTGSSARKLKRGSSNLLAGRAFVFNLFPLTYTEIDSDFDLNFCMNYGSLPEVLNIKEDIDRKRFLKAYAQTYLQEEIIAEQIVRNLPPFRRFLDIIAQHVGEIMNYSNIAKDIDSDPKTVSRYFEILEDTLLGFHLPSYSKSIRKQQKKARKFYFFDNGVIRSLAGHLDYPVLPKTFEYGQLFENFIINEIYRLLNYSEKQFKLSFLRVSDNQEIDLIIEKGRNEIILCEIKSTDKTDQRHAHNLITLGKDFPNPKMLLISRDKTKKKFGNVTGMHWRDAINKICYN